MTQGSLEALGWDAQWETTFAPLRVEGLVPARVVVQHQGLYTVHAETGELLARVSGRFRHEARGASGFPVTGDWVAVRPRAEEARGTIEALLPRRSRFARQAAGEATDPQVVAANVDWVFLVMGLDGDYNPRRLERYLALAWESGASPVVLLTKPDLCAEAEDRRLAVEALGAPVLVASPKHGDGLDAVLDLLIPGRTVALLGSSGVGKSTLVNRLLGEERLATRQVRASDDRGRHTTTSRQLLVLPSGALVIDTPGLREIQLSDSADLDAAFADVLELAGGCRFTDCAHDAEPGCAVRRAVAEERLDPARLESYRKLERERAFALVRSDKRAELERKRKWKAIHKAARNHKPRG
jgi:ribosome biogenesis GTPase